MVKPFFMQGVQLSILGTVLAAPPALAQEAPKEASDASAEIVVTAQKRTERLLDVPASVTALSSEQLLSRGALRFEDYQAQIPGLSTTSGAPGYNQINIRGVTTGGNQLSSTVATYFGDAPTNSSTSAAVGNRLTPDPDLLDIARIEVLRGPQGTLYGANALGGVLKYVFVDPELTDTHGQAQIGVSTVRHGGVGYVARGAVSTPLVQDRLGIRASGFYTRDAGFIDNVANGRKDVNRSDNMGGRIALLWKANDWLTVSAASLYHKRTNDGLPQESVNAATLKPTVGRYRQRSLTNEYLDTEYQLHSLTIDADLGFANLISATSYGRQKSSLAFDYSPNLGTVLGMIGIGGVPGVSLPVDNDVKKFTQELRLASRGGEMIDYVIGGYFTQERSRSLNGGFAYLADGTLAPAPINPLQLVDLRNRYKEYALFANGTLNLSDQFSVQAGGRWSRNKQRSVEPLEGLLFGPLAGTVISQGSSESAWTFAVSPQFKITPHWNVYARVAKGFRPGGTNLVLPGGGGTPTYASDTLINYEAGTKASLFDRRLTFSLAAFQIDWKDIQTTAKDAVGFNYLLNGGRARSRGVEGEMQWSADGLTVAANFSHIDAKLRDAVPAVGALAGDRLPYSPRWAGSFNVDYVFQSAGDIAPSLGFGIRHTGSRQAYYSQATATNPGNLTLPAFTMVDLRAGVKMGAWSLTAFVSNLFDEHALLSAATEGANPLTGDDARATIARPRTIGLTLGASF